MTRLSPEQILRLWERGKRQHPAERALSVLSLASPGVPAGDLADLSIGERDARLLSVREETFGDRLDAYVECPQCGQSLEIRLSTKRLREPEGDPPNGGSREFEIDNQYVSVRLPNSHDLLRAAGKNDVRAAREDLLSGCVLKVERNGDEVALKDLDESVLVEIERRIAAVDPRMETLLELQCPDCRHQWTTLFDIAAFLWSEIRACAQRLMQEVHVLARAYGWSEREILGLSAARRNGYLERVM